MRRLRPTFASLALLVCACSPRAAEDPGHDRNPTAALGEASPVPVHGPESSTLLDPSFALMQEICAGPCAGSSARVTVFREADVEWRTGCLQRGRPGVHRDQPGVL